MTNGIKLLFFVCIVYAFGSCQKTQKTHLYSFYYWRTHLALNDTEKSALNKATAAQLYVRYFDVDKKHGKFQPIAPATKDSSFTTDKQIVPVVFIRNRCFLQIKTDEIKLLAKQILHMVEQQHKSFGFTNFSELQIDCDWTRGTQKDYFAFLQALQSLSQKNITATLRLHQVKFKTSTGIPPVDKVYLMCYSTSSPLQNSEKNSILDTTVLKNYLAEVDNYPIKNINVALPIYSWGIVENHLGKHKIINGLSTNDLKNDNFKYISKNKVKVIKDGFYFGVFLNKGFTIKVEEISNTKREESIQFLNTKIDDYEITYYQLSHKFVNNSNLTL